MNVDHARAAIVVARRRVDTARVFAGTDDVAMAFTAAYDAARKSLVAVLAIHGLRVRPVGGAHRNTGLASAALMTDAADTIAEFDGMRQVRTGTECPEDARPAATLDAVRDAIMAASRILAACASHIVMATER